MGQNTDQPWMFGGNTNQTSYPANISTQPVNMPIPKAKEVLAAAINNMTHCLDDYKSAAESFWSFGALKMEQQFQANDDTKEAAQDTHLSQTIVTRCPLDGKLRLVHCFQASRFVPIPKTKYSVQELNEQEISQGDAISGNLDNDGMATLQLKPGVKYKVVFYPNVGKKEVEALLSSYETVQKQLIQWLQKQWDDTLSLEWKSFESLSNTTQQLLLQKSFSDGVFKGLLSAWDDIKNVYDLVAHPLDHADKTVQWAIEIDYQKLYTASKNNLHNGMSMAQDEALLFLFAYTLVNWIRLLPPNKQGEIMGEVVVSLLLDVLVGIVITGGAGLAVRYGAKAYSSLKNAGLLQKGVTELIALAARFAPTHIKKAQPILQMGEKALDSGAKATAKIGKGIEPSKTIENANVTARKFEKKTQLGTANHETKAASAGKSDANKSIESAGNTCTNNCPVSMVTGEELLTLEEGRFDGVFPFVLQRLYRSSAVETNLGMGYGWSHTLAHQLNFADGQVHWRDHEGRTIAFPEPTQQAPAITNPLAKAAIYLGRRKDEFILTQPGQPLFHFTRHGAAARLTSLTDKYRNRLLVHYNDAGELRRVELPGVHALQFYYADGLLLRVDRCVADPDTPERQWQQHVLMRYHYNAQQQLIAAENALGECERYRYDAQHVIQERRLAGGVQFFWEWEGTGKSARCVHHWSPQAGFDSRYAWQDDGSVTVINVDGSEEIYQHNDAAKLVAQTDPDGAVTTKAYDEDGHLRKETDPLGGKTEYHYNRNGELEAVVAADGQATSYEYWDGFVRKVTQGEAEWRYERNSQGDILKQTTPEGVVTRYRYSDTGQLLAVMYADGSQHQIVWNRFGQLVGEKLPQGGEVSYRYDALGRQVLTQDEHSAITRYQYDALDRVTEVTLPGGAQRRYQYNAYGKVTHFTDEQGRTTRYEYGNQLHLVTAQHNPDGSCLQFAYHNPKLFLSDITNERGEHYQLRYYPNGLVESEVDFAGRKTGYVYDLNGKLTEKHEYSSTDNSVLITQFTRDPMGRLLTKTLPDGSEVRYQYDEAGHLTAVDDGRWPLHYAYDAAGRLVAEHQSFATLRYAYNAAGQLEKCKLPDANLLTYRYLRGGLLQGIDLNGSPLTQHDYHQGLETRRQLGALHSLSQYDEQGRLREQKVQINRPVPHAFKVQRRYHYDAAGNLSQLEDSHKGAKQFFYDPLDRLTQVKGVIDEQFSHDVAGNLLSQFAKEQNHALTETQGNRLTFHGDCHYEYDGFGNLITEARGKNQQLITRYAYDCQHRLIKLEKHDGTVAEYQYDAFGRRIQKTVTDAETLTTKKTTFLWQANRLIAETDNQTHYRSFIYEPGSYKLLVQLEGKGKTAQVYYYHLDHLGTPQELTSPHGKLVWAVQYRAYGNVVRTIANEIDTPLRFQGQYFDAESGLHYNRHRYYQPDSGRFLTPDPIKLAGGLNNYQYVQNPVNWVDPLGLKNVKENGVNNASSVSSAGKNVDSGEPSIPDFYVGPSGADSTLPSTGYRYMGYKNADGTTSGYAQKAIEEKKARLSYFGFDRLSTGDEVTEAFQIRAPKHVTPSDPEKAWSDGRLRIKFNTLQLYDEHGVPKVTVPYSHGGTGKELEPFTEAYPEFGKGGARQLIPQPGKAITIHADEINILPEK